MTRIRIPRTAQEVDAQLAGLGRLLTAKEWERAALVAARVDINNPPGPRSGTSARSLLTPSQFAAKDITGLRSHHTVRRYVEAWLAVRPRPGLGETVDLPTEDWESIYSRDEDGEKIPTGGRPRASAAEIVEAIVADGPSKVTTGLARSAPALTKLVDTASAKVIAAVVSEMSDEAFENLTAAVAAVTVAEDAPAVITDTGVTPAKPASPAKIKAGEKLVKKVEDEKARKWIEERRKGYTPANPKPDGYEAPVIKAIQNNISSGEMWRAVRAADELKALVDVVLAYRGPLVREDEDLLREALDQITGYVARIYELIEAKRDSTVPDTVPDHWG